MNRIRQRRLRRAPAAEINMAPLIDMIFILLIFFIVTTSFVKESGVPIERPMAKTASVADSAHLLLEVARSGDLYLEGEPVDFRSIRPRMKRFAAETPEGAVVIAADTASQTGAVIRVLDECRIAGVKTISVAARRPEP